MCLPVPSDVGHPPEADFTPAAIGFTGPIGAGAIIRGMANVRYHVSLYSLTHVFQDSRRALTALADVALDVTWGQFLTVIGPSGCGKSTLLRIIGGLLRPSEGEVLIDGENSIPA